MNDELFELCREVYRLTCWRVPISERPVEYWVQHDDEWVLEYGTVGMPVVDGGVVPLYTSDYLLEKLLPITSIQLKRKANGDIRLFYFPEKPDYATYDYDTPLKCLLALTIALSEAEL